PAPRCRPPVARAASLLSDPGGLLALLAMPPRPPRPASDLRALAGLHFSPIRGACSLCSQCPPDPRAPLPTSGRLRGFTSLRSGGPARFARNAPQTSAPRCRPPVACGASLLSDPGGLLALLAMPPRPPRPAADLRSLAGLHSSPIRGACSLCSRCPPDL